MPFTNVSLAKLLLFTIIGCSPFLIQAQEKLVYTPLGKEKRFAVIPFDNGEFIIQSFDPSRDGKISVYSSDGELLTERESKDYLFLDGGSPSEIGGLKSFISVSQTYLDSKTNTACVVGHASENAVVRTLNCKGEIKEFQIPSEFKIMQMSSFLCGYFIDNGIFSILISTNKLKGKEGGMVFLNLDLEKGTFSSQKIDMRLLPENVNGYTFLGEYKKSLVFFSPYDKNSLERKLKLISLDGSVKELNISVPEYYKDKLQIVKPISQIGEKSESLYFYVSEYYTNGKNLFSHDFHCFIFQLNDSENIENIEWNPTPSSLPIMNSPTPSGLTSKADVPQYVTICNKGENSKIIFGLKGMDACFYEFNTSNLEIELGSMEYFKGIMAQNSSDYLFFAEQGAFYSELLKDYNRCNSKDSECYCKIKAFPMINGAVQYLKIEGSLVDGKQNLENIVITKY